MDGEKGFIIKDPSIQHPDYQRELFELITSIMSPKALSEAVSTYHSNDIAQVLTQLKKADRARLYSALDSQLISEILQYIDDFGPYLDELGLKKRADVLSRLEADSAADYLRKLDKSQRGLLIELIDDSAKRDIALLQSFNDDEIGSIMTTNYIEIELGLSVREAMRELVAQASENSNVSTIYVVDENKVFYGAIDLKDLIIAREGSPLNSLITTSYPYVYAQEQIDDCLPRIKSYSEDSIPVLAYDNRLLGVITAENFVQVVDDQFGDDYAKLAGLASEVDLNETLTQSTKKRLPWLLILLALGLVVSSVVGMFEGLISQLTFVICFQSLVLDMAGNVGTQSLAVTIRVLMDENLKSRQKLHLVIKEAKVGLINGLILGGVSLVAIGAYTCLFLGKELLFSLAVSACVAAALVISMVLSSISGTVIPLFFKKVNIDPAVASGPLITTVNDLVAVISYYSLAWLFLIQILHLA